MTPKPNSVKKGVMGDNIKIVEEVNRRKLELIIYSSFYVGFMACSEKRSITNPDNLTEIYRLISLISPQTRPKASVAKKIKR